VSIETEIGFFGSFGQFVYKCWLVYTAVSTGLGPVQYSL
jgi:hypothetical protein